VLQEGASRVCATGGQCLELTQPGETAIITSTGGKATLQKTNNSPWTSLRPVARRRGFVPPRILRMPPPLPMIPPACCAGADHGQITTRSFIASAGLIASVWLVLVQLQPSPALAQSSCDSEGPCPAPPPSDNNVTVLPCTPVTGADSMAGSINDLGKQRFNQMITHRVLGTVLLGVNEQINCSDCVSAFGSAGSFSTGIHGRKELTPNLSLLAGIAYTQFSEGGYSVTSAPIGAFRASLRFHRLGIVTAVLRYRTILSPSEKVRYRRSYVTNFGPVTVDGQTSSQNYGAYGRAGWINRISPRDEVAHPSRSGSCGNG